MTQDLPPAPFHLHERFERSLSLSAEDIRLDSHALLIRADAAGT